MEQREIAQKLAAAIDCRNWVVVRDLLCDEDVDVADVERCLVLHTLASTPDISLSLVEDIVDEILSRDVNINMADNNGDTAVMVAARCENWKVVWLLMSRQGALPDKDRVIVFLRIVSRSEHMNKNCGLSVHILGCLWESLNQTIPECHHRAIHEVLIHVAAKVNCWWLVRDLLTADIANTLDEEGLGLVHRLAKGGMNHHIYLLHKLLENGGDINLKNVDGDTATHIAVKSKNWKMLDALLRRGARVDIANNDNHTVLHTLVFYFCFLSEIWKSADTTFSLLQKNCWNIDAREGGGYTALHLAVKERNSLIAEKLLTFGARADVQDGNGRTVLHTMATHKREFSSSLLKKAIACGAGLKINYSEGNTALHLAAKLGNWGYVNDLISEGAVVTEPDSDGCTVYDRIFTNETSCICLDLPSLERFPLNVQLHLAVKLKCWKDFKNLLRKGAPINQRDRLGFTVLQRLAQMDSMESIEEVFRFLVNKGADITVRTQEGDNLLQLAAKHKNWLVVELMLKQFSPYEPDSEGFSVIHRLAEYRGRNFSALFAKFSNKTAVMSSRTPSGETLLQFSAKCGNIPMVEHLIQERDVTNINQVDSEGLSVLHRTVQYESKYTEDNIGSVVNLLLSQGANPRLRSSVGDTALHLAARHNNWDIVECLVEHGCDLNEPDSEGFYVLHRLAQTTQLRHSSLKSHKEEYEALFVMFVTKGADVFVHTSAGDSVIQLAAKHGNWTIVEHLVKLECEVNELDSEGRNVLHRLAQTTQRRQVLYNSSEAPEDTLFCNLLNKGADVYVRTSAGDSVMQLAAKHGNWEIVERLLELEWDVNELDSEGYSVLHRFAQTTQQTQVKDDIFFSTLINKGADVSVQCRTGDTALHLAAKCNNWTKVLYLVNQGCDMNQPDSEGCYILHKIAEDVRPFNNSLFTLLIDKGACPFVRSNNGDTVIHVVAKLPDWDVVKQLIERGANVNEPDSEGFHILHRLVQEPDEKILELLVAKGVNLNCRCPNIGTALHMAVKEQKWSFAERLVEFGADVNERDLEGLSILHIIACQKMDYRSHDFTPLIHLLISKGADVTACSPSGDSVFHLAARYDKWEIIEQLLTPRNHGADCQRLNSCNKRTIHSYVVERLDEPDSEGFTILQRLATKTKRNTSLLRHLLDNGVKCDTLCPSGHSAMHLAVKHDNWSLIEELLRDKTEPQSALTPSSKERFHSSSQEKLAGIKRTHNSKIERKQSGRAPFNINAKDSIGNTVLHLSAKAEKWDQVHRLLTCGANATLEDAQCSNWDIVRELLENGARADNTDSEGMPVLHRLLNNSCRKLATYPFPSVGFRKSQKISKARKLTLVKLMVHKGVDINTKNQNGLTAIQLALIKKDWKVVQLLLKRGADVDQNVAPKGKSFLHELAMDTRVDAQTATSVTEQLLTCGFRLNDIEPHGDTPLNLAAKCGNWKMVCVLLEHGADASIPDSQGWFVFHRLVMDTTHRKYNEINLSSLLLLLTRNGFQVNQTGPAGKSCIQLSLENRKWDLFWWLVESQLSFVFTLQEKKTILQHIYLITSENSDLEKVRTLILRVTERDDSFCRELTECKDKALNLSFSNCNWFVAKVLVECGADIGIISRAKPLMHLLVLKYRPEDRATWLSFLDALLARGVDINSRDESGNTILYQKWRDFIVDCRFKFSNSLLHELLDRGVSPLVADDEGQSLLTYVLVLEESLALESVKLLIELGVSTHQPALTDNANTNSGSRSLHRSPTQRAFEKKYVKAFEMLVESGASSNRELFDLSTREEETEETEKVCFHETQFDDMDDLYEYLSMSDYDYDFKLYDSEEDNYSPYRYKYGYEPYHFQDW
ncbi:hypothetical protein C0Q70_04650 [Pomacea canaliculata]|uniref:Uncharacterized protein n=1 Tax=Pomacea canaliculata TaxID=400727 RepID=A0A2T7PIZ9_POMCA|nr:hypothetical protein C0Q70_04650 [Pomacea canaliculata]